MGVELIRLSIANLVVAVLNSNTGHIQPFGVFNKKKYNKGELFLQALGGGARMTVAGAGILRAKGATFLEKGEDSLDARFTVSMDIAEDILGMFQPPNPLFCEINADREAQHELFEEKTSNGVSVLPRSYLSEVSYNLFGVFRQKSPTNGRGTSSRNITGIPTVRLFYLHRMIVPNRVYSELLRSPLARTLGVEELDTTKQGLSRGFTSGGIQMADNLSNYPGIFD